LLAERVVLVAPMTSFTFAVNAFSRELGLSHPLKARAIGEIVARFAGERELELVRCAGEMSAPLLVLHDADDRRVPAQLGRELAAVWPEARYFETRGLGHKRLLGSPEVVSRIVDFVEPLGAENQPDSGRFAVAATPPVRVAS
jgi:pimeloyl-ACP methyl ester carboxylesterase